MSKKPSKGGAPALDMTPMVDLGFLLISFFMLTTTMNKPRAMQLDMPKKTNIEDEKQDVGDCQVMTVLLDTLDRVWYYDGLIVAGLQKTTFAGDGGIRKEIIKTLKRVPDGCPLVRKWTDANGDKLKTENEYAMGKRDAIVIIKMLNGARYKNMVDILDEMDITGCKIYAIQDPNPIEVEAIGNGGVVKDFAREGAPATN